MNLHRKFFTFFLTLTVSLGTSYTGANAQGNFTSDKSRKVLSFADALEPVLPSVVQVGRLKFDDNRRLRLSGTGSGAVINAKNGYIITNSHVVNDGEAFAMAA